MCGIAGFLNRRTSLEPQQMRALVGRMNNAQAHRGPDAEGLWSDPTNTCHLGHRRLSIIDLSVTANQPMLDATSRYVTVFNGEIYNYKDLKRDLEARGVRFQTHSDTEVMLQAFIADGPAAFKRMDGMFAIAIYDTETKVLTLARDPAGEKPLYYASTPHFFAFASELRPLLELPDFTYRMSEQSMALYMALRYVPAPYTIIEGISKLEPGSIMQIAPDGTEKRERFFRFKLDDDAALQPQNLDDYATKIEGALQRSLEARLNSDVPLGAFLSSGVDSSLVCAILTKRMKHPVNTYSVGFDGDPESEHHAAQNIADLLGTKHHEFLFGASDFDKICNEIGTLLDEPNGDRSCVPTYLLAQFARQHVTVAISGDGGDEMFAGYGRYMGFIAKTQGVKWPSAGAIPNTYFEIALPVFPWNAIRETFPQSWNAVPTFGGSFADLFAQPKRAMLHALRILDFESYLPGAVLPKVDRMSMRHGLEVRTPYLFSEMYELSGRASVHMCVDGGVQKAAMRRLLSRYLPEVHVRAPKKGFGMPASVFLQNIERVKQELGKAHGVLAQTQFFGSRKGSAETFMKWAGSNTNSIWATLVLAKWIESIGPSV